MGSEIWFSEPVEKLIEDFNLPEDWKGKSLEKGMDTLDVWIDSGVQSSCSFKK